jgi:hypothetical protein
MELFEKSIHSGNLSDFHRKLTTLKKSHQEYSGSSTFGILVLKNNRVVEFVFRLKKDLKAMFVLIIGTHFIFKLKHCIEKL